MNNPHANIRLLTRLILVLVLTASFHQCKQKPVEIPVTPSTSELKLSLAQWSLHRAFRDSALSAEDFATIAKNEFGIQAIEYVNQFYADRATDEEFWKRMRAKADSLGVKSLLIMVDNEGDLGNPDAAARKTAVENHFKWVDAARILGCHSIRVNAFGEGSKEEVKAAMVDAMKQLCAYAMKDSINVVIENHGTYSSDGQWIADIMREVNLPNCGTLPDFGNWCMAVKWGGTGEESKCAEEYDRYKGVSEMLPFARGISAKSYAFDEKGEETVIDYNRMLKMVKDSNFSGYIGIEYEGEISEPEGILATKALLEKTWQSLNQP